MKEYKDRIELLNEDTTFVSAISYEDDQRLTLNTEKKISFEEGIEQGIEQGINISIQNMYKNKISIEQISKILEISQDKVKEILEKCKH